MKKLFIALLCFLLVGCSLSESTEKKETKKKVEKEEVQEEILEATFSAVGDNLIHNSVYEAAQVNGLYDFTNMYAMTNEYRQNCDINFINQETPIAGKEFTLSSYPSFNGPSEMWQSLNNSGFNWINLASNHSIDVGAAGILQEINDAKNYPNIMVTGVNDSEQSKNTPKVIEKNGLKIGVTSYTYGLNGYSLPSGQEYLVNLIDKEQIKKDITALNKVSDVQVVNMHWGIEYSFEYNAEQEELAKYLNELGVDVILGEHPHVIQDVKTIKGNKQDTLVIYSMGNFLSAQLDNYNMLGLMPTFKITYNTLTKEVQVKDLIVYPTITFIGAGLGINGEYAVYLLKDYNDEIASRHYITINEGQDLSKQYFINLVNEVVSDDVELVY